jgi:hypothetical protein
MFWKSRRAGEHYIELGRVYCPRQQRDVELDACLGCPYVEEIRGGRTPSVRCAPPARVEPAQF